MKRIVCAILIGLSCASLHGLNSARAEGPVVAPTGRTSEMDRPNTSAADTAAASLSDRWKGCAQLVFPGAGHLESNFKEMSDRPRNVHEMLENLKLARDGDWLIQPKFFDERTLLAFFNGTGVTWKERKRDSLRPSEGVESVLVSVPSNIFPDMTITVESECRIRKQASSGSHEGRRVDIITTLRFYGHPIPDMTLGIVRRVFGMETENMVDHGTVYDGPDVTPTSNGSVLYADGIDQRFNLAGVGLRFYFALGPSLKPGQESPRRIVDDDVVMTIALVEARHRVLDN